MSTISTMYPLYGIPAVIRYGISYLSDSDEPEIVSKVIEEVKNLINENTTTLNKEQIIEVVSYVGNQQDLLERILESYTKMGYRLSNKTIKKYAKKGVLLIDGVDLEELDENEEENVEYSSEERFMRHVTADFQGQIYEMVTNIYLQLFVLRIAQDVLIKYLPEDMQNKTLNRTPKDTK